MSKPFPNKIALKKFWETWPKDPSGMRARTLMLEYLGTLLVDTSLGNHATAERAQAEAGVGKVLARILEDVRGITAEKVEPKKTTVGRPLHRFTGDQPVVKPADKSDKS